MTTAVDQLSLGAKVRREMIRLGIIALYLYVCFGAIILYKTAVLQEHNIDFWPYGAAAIKALIVAKFILIGQAVHLGERHRGKPLAYFIAYQVLMFAVLIMALSFVEEIVKSAIHGKPLGEAISNISYAAWLEIIVRCILLCLILIPYFGLGAISDAIGSDRVRRMFFGR